MNKYKGVDYGETIAEMTEAACNGISSSGEFTFLNAKNQYRKIIVSIKPCKSKKRGNPTKTGQK